MTTIHAQVVHLCDDSSRSITTTKQLQGAIDKQTDDVDHFIGIDANTTPDPNTEQTGPHTMIASSNRSVRSIQRSEQLMQARRTYEQQNR